MKRSSCEGGFAALELVAGVAVLVLPVTLLVLSLPAWADRQEAARRAVREAAREVTLAGTCDVGHAEQVVRAVGEGAGLAPDALRLDLGCAAGAPLGRGGSVTARVTVAMPALTVPAFGSVAGWSWTASHTEAVDPYGSAP